MRRGLFLAGLLCVAAPARPQVAIVNGASYRPAVAPNSIASVFGTNLATATAPATSLPLPTTLAGASITVNGMAAPLFFASPAQINFLVPTGAAAGQATVAVRGPAGTRTVSTAISSTAPALFTFNSQGWGAPAAFWVLPSAPETLNPVARDDGTPVSVPGGAVLVLFATGVRNAASGSVTVTALAGNRAFPLAVEFAGAHPSFVGLDQVNVRLPAEINNLGSIDLVLAAGGARANAVRVVSGGAASAVNAFVVRAPANLRSLGAPVLAARASFAASLANYDSTQCAPSLVAWDLDLLTTRTLALPGGTCMLDAATGPWVLASSPKVFGRARSSAVQDNFQTNQVAIADLPAGAVRVAPVNRFWAATPEQLGEMLVFPGKQRPRDLYADSLQVMYTDAVAAESRPLSGRYWAAFKPAVDPVTRTALLTGDTTAAFVRLPSSPGTEFSVTPVPLAGGNSALAGLGVEVLPAAGRAVGLGSGASTGMVLFYNLANTTVNPVALPAEAAFLCLAAGAGNGLEDLDVFASSAATAAVSLFGNGCNRFLVFDGARQTVTPLATAGLAGLGPLQGLNHFTFAAARTELAGEFTRLAVLQDGTRLATITPPQVTRLDPAGLGGYPARAASNEVYVTGTIAESRQGLFVFRLDTASVTVIQAPPEILLATFAWAGRRPGRVYLYGTAANLTPQMVTFDLAARTAVAVALPAGTQAPAGYNPENAIVLFDHRDGVLAVRLE